MFLYISFEFAILILNSSTEGGGRERGGEGERGGGRGRGKEEGTGEGEGGGESCVDTISYTSSIFNRADLTDFR